MPSQSGKSPLFAKYGNKLNEAVIAHASERTTTGMQRMPPGIRDGVARLIECGFGKVAEGKQNAGEYYFRAAGVALKPKSILIEGEAIPVAGKQTSIMEMACDTKDSSGKVTTQQEHFDRICQHLRSLGGEEYTEGADGSTIEGLANALVDKDNPVFFNFSTSLRKGREYIDAKTKQKKMGEDGVWENWHGTKGLEDFSPNGEMMVEDHSGDDQPPSDESVATSEEAPATAADIDADGALSDLAEKSEKGDKAARRDLTKFAVEAGVAEADVENAKDWAAVVDMIRQASGSVATEEAAAEPEPEPEPEKEWEPSKGEFYKFKPLDKNGKPVLDAKRKPKVVEVEVTTVNKAKKMVDLVNNADKKTAYKAVKWDALESIE